MKKQIKVAEFMTGKVIGYVGNGSTGFSSIQIKTDHGHYLHLTAAKGFIKVTADTIPYPTDVEIDYTADSTKVNKDISNLPHSAYTGKAR